MLRTQKNTDDTLVASTMVCWAQMWVLSGYIGLWGYIHIAMTPAIDDLAFYIPLTLALRVWGALRRGEGVQGGMHAVQLECVAMVGELAAPVVVVVDTIKAGGKMEWRECCERLLVTTATWTSYIMCYGVFSPMLTNLLWQPYLSVRNIPTLSWWPMGSFVVLTLFWLQFFSR